MIFYFIAIQTILLFSRDIISEPYFDNGKTNEIKIGSTNSNDEYLSPINLEKYKGVYLPFDYVKLLEKTCCHDYSLKKIGYMSAFLDVKSDHIEGNINYDDGFWIKRDAIAKYDFSKYMIGIIEDENHKKYIKISNSDENRINTIKCYIIKKIFKYTSYKSAESILTIEKDASIKIDDSKWVLNLNTTFNPSDLDVWYQDEKVIGIKIEDNKIEIIELRENEGDPGYNDDREIIHVYSKYDN